MTSERGLLLELSTTLIRLPATAEGAALELRRPLGQPLDERDHFLHPLSQLRLGLLRTLGEGGLERVLQIRDGDPEHLEQTARAVLSHGSLLLLRVLGRAHGQPVRPGQEGRAPPPSSISSTR